MSKTKNNCRNDLILGVETSCDETSIALSNGCHLLKESLTSSLKKHRKYGGIVPEIASRHQLHVIDKVFLDAVSPGYLQKIKAVAATTGPGLAGSLLVGLNFAKTISYILDVPFISVNHIFAHIWANFIDAKYDINFPFVGLAISGGHTSLIHAKSLRDTKLLGQTQDDAVGEVLDKIAKFLGLGYPGGPIIEQYASRGKKAIKFNCWNPRNSFDFSFSGVKTGVIYFINDLSKKQKIRNDDICNICAGLQESMFSVVSQKAIQACEATGSDALLIGGGVSANSRFREIINLLARPKGIKVYIPPKKFCVDNGSMVAVLGYFMYKEKLFSDLAASVDPNKSLYIL